MKMVVERRKEGREQAELRVNYQAGGTLMFAQAANISTLGIFLRTDSPLPPGTSITLSFTLPEAVSKEAARAPEFVLEGTVVWNSVSNDVGQPTGMGVEFVGATADERRLLLALIETVATFENASHGRGSV